MTDKYLPLEAAKRFAESLDNHDLVRFEEAVDEWLHELRRRPAVRRHHAEGLARDIAFAPGMYRHWIGADDLIVDNIGPTPWRMTDFLPESSLVRYRGWSVGCSDYPEHLRRGAIGTDQGGVKLCWICEAEQQQGQTFGHVEWDGKNGLTVTPPRAELFGPA